MDAQYDISKKNRSTYIFMNSFFPTRHHLDGEHTIL